MLLLVASAYLLVRALDSGRTRTLVWCGVLVGLAFMTKMLQGWMVVPALGAVYLVAGPPRLAVRFRQLALAAGAMVAVSAAWPVAVSLWPSASRPWIGGSTDGSVWDLIFGYNGFGRLTGAGAGPPGGGATFGGEPGLLRMLNAEVGGQIAWLLPLAAVSLVTGLWLTRRAPRTDRRRAGWILFGTWAIVHVAVFSSQHGVFHPYYVSALAPAVAALAGAGVVTLWRWARRSWTGVGALVVAIVGTAWVSVAMLARTSDFAPALRTLIPMAAAVASVGAVALRTRRARRWVAAGAAVGAFALVAGPASYSFATVGHTLFANNVQAGPASAQSGPGAGAARGGFGAGGPPGFGPPPGVAGGFGPPPGAGGFGPPRGAGAPPGLRGGFPGGARTGGQGGPRATVSKATLRYLEAHQGSAKYLVAATGSQVTAPIIIETGKAVVTIGGFNGSDPTPTASQLAALVKRGELKYVLFSNGGGGPPGTDTSTAPSNRGGGPPGAGTSTALEQWVKAHGTVVRSDGMTLYRVRA